MGYAKHVGRVGALAVALGIGAAVATTPPVSWADDETQNVQEQKPPETPGDPTTPGSSTPPGERQDPGEVIRKRLEHAGDDLRDGIRKAITGVVRSSGGAITSTHRNGSNSSNGNVPPVVVEDEEEQPVNSKPPKDEEKSSSFVANVNGTNPLGSFASSRWRAPQGQVNTGPATKPIAKSIEDVKVVVQQSIDTVTGKQPGTGSTVNQRNAFSTLDTPETQEQQQVRPRLVAPVAIITNVLNAALAPFLNPTPGQPAPQNPILWAVLGWVRRQIANEAPTITAIGYGPDDDPETQGVLVIDVDAEDDNAAPDELKYRVTTDGEKGSVAPNDDGTFTYTPNADWDGIAYTDSLTVTVSDIGTGFHLHGLDSIFHPISAHATTRVVEINVPAAASTAPEVIELPEGYTAVPNSRGTVGPDGALYRPTKKDGTDSYALVVQRPGGETTTIELPGEPIGELAFGPGGTLYQNTQTPNAATGGYDYAMTVITPAPAAARFALMASSALDSGQVSVTLPGEPVGLMAIGSDGTAYQPIRPTGEIADPGAPCVDCSVAIVLPGSETADIVTLRGDLLNAPPKVSSPVTPERSSMVTAGPNRTAYLTTTDYSSQTTTVWRVDANTATVEDIPLTDGSGAVVSGATIGADGTAYITTQVVTAVVTDNELTGFTYDTKLWVIAPTSDTATPFQLDGEVYGPVAVDNNGIAYVTTSRIELDDSAEPTVIWRFNPTGPDPVTPIEVEGQPSYSVLVAPDGTAYQTVYRDSDNGQQFLMAVVSPASTSAVLVDLGTFRSVFGQPMTITPQGTVYQVLGNFDFDTETGDTTVFVFNGTTHVAIPLEGVVVLPAIVDADGKMYVAAATNIDLNTYTGDETLWVISPGGAPPVGVVIGRTLGVPVSLAVGDDSAFLTTYRDDPNDPTKLIYDVTGVPIPSQAV
jgi:cadherin-like protein